MAKKLVQQSVPGGPPRHCCSLSLSPYERSTVPWAQAVKVGKLFAKHFKVGEQQEALSKAPLAIAVGTPNRLGKLADLGALRLDRVKYLLVDVALDAKQRCALSLCRPDRRRESTRREIYTFATHARGIGGRVQANARMIAGALSPDFRALGP